MFGDSMNDMQMIENSDIGIVMQNGDSYLKNIATKVIGHTDEQGLLRFIEEIEKEPTMLEKMMAAK
jgi:hydroxymethylpyrimidine pyrophosphatase-like HAD family hydrolase